MAGSARLNFVRMWNGKKYILIFRCIRFDSRWCVIHSDKGLGSSVNWEMKPAIVSAPDNICCRQAEFFLLPMKSVVELKFDKSKLPSDVTIFKPVCCVHVHPLERQLLLFVQFSFGAEIVRRLETVYSSQWQWSANWFYDSSSKALHRITQDISYTEDFTSPQRTNGATYRSVSERLTHNTSVIYTDKVDHQTDVECRLKHIIYI